MSRESVAWVTAWPRLASRRRSSSWLGMTCLLTSSRMTRCRVSFDMNIYACNCITIRRFYGNERARQAKNAVARKIRRDCGEAVEGNVEELVALPGIEPGFE